MSFRPIPVQAIFFGPDADPAVRSTCACGNGLKAGILLISGFSVKLCRPCIESALRNQDNEQCQVREVDGLVEKMEGLSV